MLRANLCAVVVWLGCSALSVTSTAADRIDLSPARNPDALTRVTVELEAGGHNLFKTEATAQEKAQDQRLPMSVAAKLQYNERSLAQKGSVGAANKLLAARYYERAEAVIKVEETGRTPSLADDRRLILVQDDADRHILYCPDGPLTREQLDLIDVVGDSLVLDQLLPAGAVAKDESWAHDATVMGPLLTLDSVAVCEVKSVLEGYNDSFAKIRLEGTVHGMAEGAATELEVRAVYLFDRKSRRVTRLNLAVRERRSIGGATPGLEAVAKMQISVAPLQHSTHLHEEAIGRATAAARTATNDLVYESRPIGLRFMHDRQWFITSDQRESVTLRRVDRGDLVAQCTFTALPPKSAGRQTSLEQFQKDVTYSLGKNFGEMVSSRQWQNAAGLYCYELVARGIVDEVPVEWHYYLFAPESGDRVSAAVTLEKPMVDRVGQADRELAESVQLFPRMPMTQTATQPGRSVK
jgi:hypothetical protein